MSFDYVRKLQIHIFSKTHVCLFFWLRGENNAFALVKQVQWICYSAKNLNLRPLLEWSNKMKDDRCHRKWSCCIVHWHELCYCSQALQKQNIYKQCTICEQRMFVCVCGCMCALFKKKGRILSSFERKQKQNNYEAATGDAMFAPYPERESLNETCSPLNATKSNFFFGWGVSK